MGTETWWSHVVQNTISPVLKAANIKESRVFPGLSNALIHHFSSDKAYTLHNDARKVLHAIQKLKLRNDHTAVGIISNSDHRLITILRSLGLKLSAPEVSMSSTQDFNFVLLSYDTGKPKPQTDMFCMAEELYATKLGSLPGNKLYIGDDFKKDATAAAKAGWDCILIDRDNSQAHHFDSSNRIQVNGAIIERVTSLWPMSSSLWP